MTEPRTGVPDHTPFPSILHFRPKRPWHECNRAQQAALLGQNVIFQGWIGAADKNEAAEIIRTRCDVESRRELDTIPAATERWDKLSREFFDRHNLASLEESYRDGPVYEPPPIEPYEPPPVLKASRKRITILFAMLHGYWPWQDSIQRWTPSPSLVRSGKKFKIGDISISNREHETLLAHGVIAPFVDGYDNPDYDAFTITETGREWLKSYWTR